MTIKYLIAAFIMGTSLSISAQTQSWQWVKAGGSSSDNSTGSGIPIPAECKIAGCDAYGNVYAVGNINGENVVFDTFSCAGTWPYIANSTYPYPDILLFSYNCGGTMRWAKHIGDQLNLSATVYGATTDVYGNTFIARSFYYGYYGGCNSLQVYLGDSTINSTPPSICQSYLCLIKYDSLGRLVWFKNMENDTVQHTYTQTYAYGLRVGSSGNLWMGCNLDSNYSISPNLHTNLAGKYNVEVDPNNGNILGGYYISNQFFGDQYSIDTYFDLDENENYYETGTLFSGDTLILTSQKVSPDPSVTEALAYIYSLDKNGNFRYIIHNTNYANQATFTACKYDFQTKSFVSCWGLDSGNIYGSDTFNFSPNNVSLGSSRGLFSIDPSGNILWGKYVTYTNSTSGGFFNHAPTSFYFDHLLNNGLTIYNNNDTLFNKDTSSSVYDFTTIVSQTNSNGSLIATHTAHLGVIGTGDNSIKYGCTDWRGNVYLGGTVTNFFATPADSVVNTDGGSGNFFIAKLGISDCSCPTPGVQFTDAIHGDTVFFYGSSINRRDSIHWHLGDGSSFSGDTLFHVYTSHDSTYTVTAIAYSGCGVDSVTRLISVTTGIKPIDLNKTKLYPNPATNTVNLEVSAPATIGLVYANGASVWNTPIQVNQQGSYVFDMSKYACAMYYFIVQYTNGKTDVMQVVKE